MPSQETVVALLEQMAENCSLPLLGNLDFYRAGVGCVLHYLSTCGRAVSAGEISQHMNVSTARVAVLLRKMEERNLILRQRDAQDARRTLIRISPVGEAVHHDVQQKFITWMRSVIEQVGMDKIQQFMAISVEIKQAMEQESQFIAPDLYIQR